MRLRINSSFNWCTVVGALYFANMFSLKVWNCSLCEWFAAVSLKVVMHHIGSVHMHEAGFHICCGIDGCPRTYKNFASYRQHLYRVHRDVLDISTSISVTVLFLKMTKLS